MKPYKQLKVITIKDLEAFYSSIDWKLLRNKALFMFNNKCCICSSSNNLTIVPIKNISYNWLRRLDLNNLQCLCKSCKELLSYFKINNNKDYMDFRSPYVKNISQSHTSAKNLLKRIRNLNKTK